MPVIKSICKFNWAKCDLYAGQNRPAHCDSPSQVLAKSPMNTGLIQTRNNVKFPDKR